MSDETKPTLTDAKGSGGMVAQSGFDYQLWETLSRLPGWLLQPAFEHSSWKASKISRRASLRRMPLTVTSLTGFRRKRAS
ncbi:hypothetical protein [Deinococcus sp. LM3]|uniref:hypothetical protein n=1 Tax=Deinococcus sp. LM3 TaxID=1938608 RepID=UPI00117F211C|nr:hypothetical protein [Deinococcus sp. LM3]